MLRGGLRPWSQTRWYSEARFRPEGPERHLDAARQKLPRDNFWAAQLLAITLTAGAILKDGKISSISWGRGSLGGILRDNYG